MLASLNLAPVLLLRQESLNAGQCFLSSIYVDHDDRPIRSKISQESNLRYVIDCSINVK